MKPAQRALTLVLATSVFLGCNAEAQKPQAEGTPPATSAVKLTGTRVEVAVVSLSSRSLEVTIPGEVEGFRDAELASSLGGFIEDVRVAEGDRVKEGQVLGLVDSATHGARQARGHVELEAAKRELERAKALGAAIPKAELDQAQDRVSNALATLRELNVNASRAVIKSPFKGIVVARHAEEGEVAGPGTPLFRVVQLSPIKVTVALSDRDVALAQPGTLARIQLDAQSGIFEGKVVQLSQAAELKTRAFKATIEVPNADEKLLPGMIARVTLSANAQKSPEGENAAGKGAKAATKGEQTAASAAKPGGEDLLVISQDWLVTKPSGVGVFVEKDGKAVWRDVELGEVLRRSVVVRSGLNAGDALIIVGHRELAEGDDVLVHRRGTCCTAGRAVF